MAEQTIKVSMLLSSNDGDEADLILRDLIQMLREKAFYWGYGLETHTPYTLIGEVK